MSDKLKSGNFSFDTYVTKQESLLLEYIRKTINAETKIVILESALQEMYKKVEELNQQIEAHQVTIDQSITGLQAVSVEKQNLLNKVERLEKSLDSCNNEKSDIRSHANIQGNTVAVLKNEIKELNNKVQTTSDDYSTLKENYSKVLAAFEEANKKIEQLEAANTQEHVVAQKQKKRPKKIEETESEWVDGEYKIPT